MKWSQPFSSHCTNKILCWGPQQPPCPQGSPALGLCVHGSWLFGHTISARLEKPQCRIPAVTLSVLPTCSCCASGCVLGGLSNSALWSHHPPCKQDRILAQLRQGFCWLCLRTGEPDKAELILAESTPIPQCPRPNSTHPWVHNEVQLWSAGAQAYRVPPKLPHTYLWGRAAPSWCCRFFPRASPPCCVALPAPGAGGSLPAVIRGSRGLSSFARAEMHFIESEGGSGGAGRGAALPPSHCQM